MSYFDLSPIGWNVGPGPKDQVAREELFENRVLHISDTGLNPGEISCLTNPKILT